MFTEKIQQLKKHISKNKYKALKYAHEEAKHNAKIFG